MFTPHEFMATLLTGVHGAVCAELDCTDAPATPIVQLFDLEVESFNFRPLKPVSPDSYQIGASMQWEGRTTYTETVIPIQDIQATGLAEVLLKSVAKMTGVELVRMSENHEEPPPSVFDFSGALYHLKQGRAVRRNAWLPGVFITLVPGSTITVSEGRPLAEVVPVGTKITYSPHLDMVVGSEMFPWTCSVDNLLAMDWSLTK